MNIPPTLCDGSKLIIPNVLTKAYLASLVANDLLTIATAPRPDPAPVGGQSKEATDLHYAHAFDGSVARAQLAILDPKTEVPTTAKTLLRFLSGGTLSFIDVPCGAGAAALSILCTAAELRKSGILPREPLNVNLLWGEISPPALEYAHELMTRVKGDLAQQAIFVNWSCFSWDVLSELSNAQLVERIVVSKTVNMQTLLLISNFNGFLENQNKKVKAYPQIAELLKYSSGKLNAAVWIEPNMNKASQGLFPFIMTKLKTLTGFAKPSLSGLGNETTDFKFALPITPLNTANVRLCVMPLDLIKGAY